MAKDTYTAVGNARDISEIISNIAPSDTPIYSKIAKTTATATNHEWLEDALGDGAENAKVEGFAYTTSDPDPREELGNYCQIMSRGYHTTDTQEVVQKHGLKSEIAYQMQKAMKLVALDCEFAIIKNDAKVAGSTAVARKMGGLPYWIVSNVFANGGTQRAFTFGLLNDAMEQTFVAGGNPTMLVVSPRNKRVVSGFTAGNTKNMDGGDKKLTNMISVIETDFGTLRVVANRRLQNSDVYGLSPEYMKKAFLRAFGTKDLPKTEDKQKKVIVGEWTLEMRNEAAHFRIGDLNGAAPALP